MSRESSENASDANNTNKSSDVTFLDAGGVDEVSVIPWSLLLRQKLVQRVGVSRRKATLGVLLGCVFTVSFMITLLVVSLKTVADDLNSTTGVISWAITAPMLAFGVVGPAFVVIGDLHDESIRATFEFYVDLVRIPIHRFDADITKRNSPDSVKEASQTYANRAAEHFAAVRPFLSRLIWAHPGIPTPLIEKFAALY